jgi:hypothetical protein
MYTGARISSEIARAAYAEVQFQLLVLHYCCDKFACNDSERRVIYHGLERKISDDSFRRSLRVNS